MRLARETMLAAGLMLLVVAGCSRRLDKDAARGVLLAEEPFASGKAFCTWKEATRMGSEWAYMPLSAIASKRGRVTSWSDDERTRVSATRTSLITLTAAPGDAA